jgi:hypothetical protein
MKKIFILMLSLFIITPVYAKSKYSNKQNKLFHSGALKKKKYKK